MSLLVAREEVYSKQHLLVLATYTTLIVWYTAVEEVEDCFSKQIDSGEMPI